MPPKAAPGELRGGRRGGRGGGRGTSPSHGGPAASVEAIGVRRPGPGTAGRQLEVITNNFAIEFDQGTIHHYDGMYLSFFSKGFTK